jgi:hypothetical protein
LKDGKNNSDIPQKRRAADQALDARPSFLRREVTCVEGF